MGYLRKPRQQQVKVYSNGMGLLGWLTIAFVVLKLTGVIDWSWWWVTAPLWGPIALVLAIVGAIALGVLTLEGIKELKDYIKKEKNEKQEK